MKGSFQNAMRRFTKLPRSLALRSAGKQGSGTSVIHHVGRRSGQAYQTPVTVVERDSSFVIALPYGERTDWLRNVLAQGSATLVIGGSSYAVDKPEVLPMDVANSYFPPKTQRLLKRFGVESALQLHRG
ncbi:nitroreductase family deazaflavin-dependent oxidoreductase [Nocardia alni]|uniref:nitroreductase family deazaflavin-dependent oxidoreductase n=1 Tax=Nocardia alni TaxID=2815723 RepID=UPI001C250295|nr:nitroreductase family deazaflavin-dependent oxidoreductase [Nocardia alni]